MGESMKKKILIMTLMGTMFVGGVVFGDALNGTYRGFPIAKLFINGNEINNEVPAIIVDGNTLVPLRVISNALGQDISWDGNTQTVYVGSKSNNQITTNSNGSTVQTGDNGYYQFIGVNNYNSGFVSHVAGQIKNISGNKSSFIQVTVTLFDANGGVVGTNSAYVQPLSLENGETGSFDVTFFNPPQSAVRYQVNVKGQTN